MLEHPWLKMPNNLDYKMQDEDWEKLMNKVKEDEGKKKLAEALRGDNEKEGKTFSEYEESDEELHAGDQESVDLSDDSLSLGNGDSDNEYKNLFTPGYC